jgi:hypothetical protein
MTRPILALVLFLAASAAAADVAAIAKNAGVWRAQNEGAILREFSDLLAIPNLATDSENIARNADAISASCTRRGLSVRLLRIAKAPPQRQCGQASHTEQAQGGSWFGHRPDSHVKLIAGGDGVSLLNQKGICPRSERRGKTGGAWGEAWVCHQRQQIDADC